jgi:small-conductance mechanosensitive channel
MAAGIRLILWLVFAVALFAVVWWLARPLFARLDADVARLLAEPLFQLGKVAVSPLLVFKVLLFLVLLTLATRLTRRFLRDNVLSRTSMDAGQRYALARIAGYVVFVLGLTIGLQSAGVNLSSLVVVGGALGIGVGFGLQNIASNFISGLVLLVERPVKLGDRVEVGDTYGDVVRIAGRSTWVRTNDNVVIIIPNSEFINSRVTNWTANDRQVRFSLPVGVSYGSNPDQVRQILLDVARRHPDVMADPGPEVLFIGFGDSSLDFSLRVWTTNQVQTPRRLKSDLYFAIFQAFREHGVEIPFPQRDLHLKSVAAPLSLSGGS